MFLHIAKWNMWLEICQRSRNMILWNQIITSSCENLMLFMVRITCTSFKPSASIRMARYSKKFCRCTLCRSICSLKLPKLGNHRTHTTSFHGIGFFPSLEMMVWNGWYRSQKILTTSKVDSKMEVCDKDVVASILDGSKWQAKFEE